MGMMIHPLRESHLRAANRTLRSCVGLALGWIMTISAVAAQDGSTRELTLDPGTASRVDLGLLRSGRSYSLVVSSLGTLAHTDRIVVILESARADPLARSIHAGDPDFTLVYRPTHDGEGRLVLSLGKGSRGPVILRVRWDDLDVPILDLPAIEAEPNDSWKTANTLVLGRTVHGTADDIDYLNGPTDLTTGRDWFRFDIDKDSLVFFELDLLDRDVPANSRLVTVDEKSGVMTPYLAGKDPMEMVHDRERARFSKFISRTLIKGRYYLEIDARHPDYRLRTKCLPVPPYTDPRQAVETGLRYLIDAGDAWFAQIPRGGSTPTRAGMLHETAQRCTACHAASFPTEAALAAHASGYAIEPRANFEYLIERLYHSITPLYGDQGLYWQRFIAIPLEAQGAQGGVLLDYERQIRGHSTRFSGRFGPFFAAAWASRSALPDDAQNGVLPRDSKFSQAWRDYRVLNALGTRGDADHARAAAQIAEIVGERAADRSVENLQDRVDRLRAWGLIDKDRFKSKITRETGALLALQNPDGGWPEQDSGPGPSAVYLTGQLVWTLLELGHSPEEPALGRGLAYLLGRQRGFGGWIQDETQETFRTPMRETRYAVMALAKAYPRLADHPREPNRAPRTGSLVETLEDLENLVDVPEADRESLVRVIIPLLDDRRPLVRSSAAACLGRLGRPEAAEALARHLGDDSKIVCRAAAWALRRLGDHDQAAAVIARALASPDPRVRRGACRVFAAQFYRLDERLDILDRLVPLCGDADLGTRLQAIRALTQWFYRIRDHAARKRIIATVLERLGQPDIPLVRDSLRQGLYIMLDENLGGGVSLQKNLEVLPLATRRRVLDARIALERETLVNPLLSALKDGNSLVCSGVLAAFDGSFLKGRTYARQPTGMIDIGNDREFSLLYQPDPDRVAAALKPVLETARSPLDRERALKLAAFLGASLDVVAAAPMAKPPREERSPAVPRPATFERFKSEINPLFYQQGEDGYSCADCHASHALLRIAAVDSGDQLTDDQLRENLNGLMKTINRDDPRSSLILLKPRSPHGQGDPDPDSPTGLTHAGGPRWSSDDHPAYRAILEWIQAAGTQ